MNHLNSMPGRYLCAMGLLAALGAGTARAGVLYDSQGFENPPFILGSVAGQDGWTALGPGTSTAEVGTTTVLGGTQSLEVGFVQATPGASVDRFTREVNMATNDQVVTIAWDMYVEANAGQDFGPGFGAEAYVGDSVPNSVRVAGMWLDAADGSLIYLDSPTSVDFGAMFSLDAWHQYELIIDHATDTARGLVDGLEQFNQPFLSPDPAAGGGVLIDAPIIAVDTDDPGFGNPSGTAYYDNYLITDIPEPATAGITGAALLLICAARSRRG